MKRESHAVVLHFLDDCVSEVILWDEDVELQCLDFFLLRFILVQAIRLLLHMTSFILTGIVHLRP